MTFIVNILQADHGPQEDVPAMSLNRGRKAVIDDLESGRIHDEEPHSAETLQSTAGC